MAQAHVNGVEIAYQQLGSGPDLIMVHGLAANRAFWFAQYAMPLSQDYRVTLFDLRGHGYSGRPDSGYDARTMSEDLRGLLDHLGIARCALIGHSYGGSVAMEFAAQRPARVKQLVLLDTKLNSLQPEMRLADSPELSPFEREVANRSGLDWDRETQVGLRFLEVLARWKISGESPTTRDDAAPFGEGRSATRTARQLIELLDRTSARADFIKRGLSETEISALRVPLLLIYGNASRCMPTYRSLEKLLPDAKRELIPQGGHFFPLSHASRTLQYIREFLSSPKQLET